MRSRIPADYREHGWPDLPFLVLQEQAGIRPWSSLYLVEVPDAHRPRWTRRRYAAFRLRSGHILPSHHTHTHTHTHNRFMAVWILSGTTQLSRYQKKNSPSHTYSGHQSSLICFIHLLWSRASSLFYSRAWQSFSTISLQVFFGLPLGLAPSTSYSIHFFTQSLYSFCTYAHTITQNKFIFIK